MSAQQLLPHRLKNLNPSYQSYPPKNDKNIGSCKVRLINVLFLENLEQLQKCAAKKNRESSPLEGPSPCGKTGLAPCRQSTFPSFLFVAHVFSHLIFSDQNSKFKPKNPTYKNRPPKSPPKACLPNSFVPTGSKI